MGLYAEQGRWGVSGNDILRFGVITLIPLAVGLLGYSNTHSYEQRVATELTRPGTMVMVHPGTFETRGVNVRSGPRISETNRIPIGNLSIRDPIVTKGESTNPSREPDGSKWFGFRLPRPLNLLERLWLQGNDKSLGWVADSWETRGHLRQVSGSDGTVQLKIEDASGEIIIAQHPGTGIRMIVGQAVELPR